MPDAQIIVLASLAALYVWLGIGTARAVIPKPRSLGDTWGFVIDILAWPLVRI